MTDKLSVIWFPRPRGDRPILDAPLAPPMGSPAHAGIDPGQEILVQVICVYGSPAHAGIDPESMSVAFTNAPAVPPPTRG